MKNYIDTGWEVLICGCPHDLRQLTHESLGDFFSVYGGVDHWLDCPNDDFRLSSKLFKNLDNASDVFTIANELIQLFSGATRLVGWDTPFIYKVDDILLNERPVTYSINGKFKLPDNHKNPIIPNNKSFHDSLKIDVRYGLIELSINNQDVWAILHYLSEEPSFTTLSKVIDAIKGYAKFKEISFEFDKLVTDFNNTANNFSISVLDARHGYKIIPAGKKNNTGTMDIKTATNFIRSEANKYLLSAYPLLSNGGKFNMAR